MNQIAIIEQLKTAAVFSTDESSGDALIGLFQAFRPHGLPESTNLANVPGGKGFADRLAQLYAATKNSQRQDKMKDAYFIVRKPPMIDADQVAKLTHEFLTAITRLVRFTNDEGLGRLLDPVPRVRILEGKPPKHPRAVEERADLLIAMERTIPALVDHLTPKDSLAGMLGQALYFTACDAFLRDYLRWPLLESPASEIDPFAAYFELWRHGVKFRVFRNDQIDFYLPYRANGILLDAGQFAGQG